VAGYGITFQLLAVIKTEARPFERVLWNGKIDELAATRDIYHHEHEHVHRTCREKTLPNRCRVYESISNGIAPFAHIVVSELIFNDRKDLFSFKHDKNSITSSLLRKTCKVSSLHCGWRRAWERAGTPRVNTTPVNTKFLREHPSVWVKRQQLDA